jgi:hypothetical protein
MKQSYCTLGDIFPFLKEDLKMADNQPLKKQKQDKSPLKGVVKEVKKNDKKDNSKKREGIKDRR